MLLDPEAVLIEYLRTQPVWTALAERISAGPNLPTGYRPAQGAAILLSLRSMSQDYSRGVAPAIVQFTTYAFDAVTVRAAEKKLYESLNDKSSPKMLGCFFHQTPYQCRANPSPRARNKRGHKTEITHYVQSA